MSKVSINESTLTNIGAAIREKTGKTDLIAPGDMPAEILAIVSGGGGGDIEFEPIVLTDNCTYACANQMATNYLKTFGDTVTTNDITNAEHMFLNSGLETIPFELNFKSGNNTKISSIFYNAKKLKQIPKINNLKIYYTCNYLFYGCQELEEIPDNLADNWDLSYYSSNKYNQVNGLFGNCYKLKEVPMSLVNKFAQGYQNTTPSGGLYYNGFLYCESLREVLGLPVLNVTFTSNAFSSTVSGTNHLQRFTFVTNEDGTPKTANWKNQTLDFTNGVGFGNTKRYESWNIVSSDEEYELYKDDIENYQARTVEYSLYNHTAAVETINSLPDCTSSGGTNTIKFRGNLGANTDGGAINTLTQEEIAVAAAKGWTVTLT